ncbi:MAG: TetR/AcrR family transcriptional regulator, partial [Pseudomonadota bacterium]|nr:TetR/AcrR family transcriptional regulator [Pseudomonadota bacterium]
MTNPNLEQFSYQEPIQPRAARTFALILKTSLAIIERESIDALNTNKVAKESGINISTLYRYFPNKDSIIYTLYKQWFDRVATITNRHRLSLSPGMNQRKMYASIVEDILNIDGFSPKAAVALEQAIKVRAELAPYDKYITELSLEFYAGVLVELGADASEAEIIIAASFMLMSVWGAIALAADSSRD